MNKWAYFIIQFVMSTFIMSLVWYLFAVTNTETVTGELSFTPLFLFLGGILIHLVLTIIYILVGWRKVDEWRWWFILISAGINIVTFFIGIEGAVAIQYLIWYY
ncbi:MAG: hypothetical protein IKZ42_01415 [Clostridiales bacterium]|nr:hypothetical protein [Clostridiales bacterium]